MLYPAIDISNADPEFAVAVVDDFSPAAVEEHDGSLTIYFSSTSDRDAAQGALALAFPDALLAPREVDDEDWAKRSQQNLRPITIGDITIHPSVVPQDPPYSLLPTPSYSVPPTPYSLIVVPSMGFGTGHHQTTRLCLAAMQSGHVKRAIEGASFLDVGTGSGILALAARLFGAAAVTGIDIDADAMRAAQENLEFNQGLDRVTFGVADLETWLDDSSGRHDRSADLVTANLTGALLVRSAATLASAVRAGGYLILSGLLKSEETLVIQAFVERTHLVSITSEDEWVCLVLKKP